MTDRFSVIYSGEALQFLDSLPQKDSDKIYYNIKKASEMNDRELFKKVDEDIWEFRTLFRKMQYRLLAFWDK